MKMTVPRGASVTYNLTFADPEGKPYVLADGELVLFGVKKYRDDDEYVLFKTLTHTDRHNGVYPLKFCPEDTQHLACREYFYGVGVQSGEDYYPGKTCCPFEVTPNVPQKVVSPDG